MKATYTQYLNYLTAILFEDYGYIVKLKEELKNSYETIAELKNKNTYVSNKLEVLIADFFPDERQFLLKQTEEITKQANQSLQQLRDILKTKSNAYQQSEFELWPTIQKAMLAYDKPFRDNNISVSIQANTYPIVAGAEKLFFHILLLLNSHILDFVKNDNILIKINVQKTSTLKYKFIMEFYFKHYQCSINKISLNETKDYNELSIRYGHENARLYMIAHFVNRIKGRFIISKQKNKPLFKIVLPFAAKKIKRPVFAFDETEEIPKHDAPINFDIPTHEENAAPVTSVPLTLFNTVTHELPNEQNPVQTETNTHELMVGQSDPHGMNNLLGQHELHGQANLHNQVNQLGQIDQFGQINRHGQLNQHGQEHQHGEINHYGQINHPVKKET